MGRHPVIQRCPWRVGARVLLVLGVVLACSCTPAARAQEPPEPGFPNEREALELPVALAVPAHFRALPEVARAAEQTAATAPGVALASWAFGDPATGCHVLINRVRAPDGDDRVHDAVRDALFATGVHVDEWRPVGGRAPGARAHIRIDDIRGQVRTLALRATTPAPRFDVITVACFYNQRDPVASALLCEQLLSTLEAKP